MSNEDVKKTLRDELGDGYLNLLDSVRHSFEQAAWGQEGSGNLGDDFYRWVGAAEDAPKAIDAAELGGGVEVRAGERQDAEWSDLKDAVDSSMGKEEARKARRERENDVAKEKDEELEAGRAGREVMAGAVLEAGASRGEELER